MTRASKVRVHWLTSALAFVLLLSPLSSTVAANAGFGSIESLRLFFGPLRASYNIPGQLVSIQVGDALELASPDVQLLGGNTLVSGCRRHDCEEKAAIVVNAEGQVLTAGLIN